MKNKKTGEGILISASIIVFCSILSGLMFCVGWQSAHSPLSIALSYTWVNYGLFSFFGVVTIITGIFFAINIDQK